MMHVLIGTVKRGRENWIVDLHGLPEGRKGTALGTTWVKAQRATEELAEHILGAPSGSVMINLELEDSELQALIDEAKRTKAKAREAQAEADAALGMAARTLTQDATVRDVAAMLGISHQYVAKLAPKVQD